MHLQLVLSVAALVFAAVLSVALLRRRQKDARRVFLTGLRNTGKTRLFLALSEKDTEEARSVPTLEDHAEKLSSGILLVDTPGNVFSPTSPLFSSLKPTDTVLYLFSEEKDRMLSAPPCKVVQVYTGEKEMSAKDYDARVFIKEGSISPKDVKHLRCLARM
ncbi:hypothetical protein NECID01_0974 [Nematocida sp. AWRm77]|nr:hypothetical protein NECID01_0974 [Nematocida sp. AWRm77]